MKSNFTSINVLIDASGSMARLTADTIGGFNQFLKSQKDVPGEAVLSLWTFSNTREVVHEFKNLTDVPDLNNDTYKITGATALLDSLAQSVDDTGKYLASLSEEDRPSKVIFLIITDGQENASRKFTKEQVKEMVTHQTEKYSWDFIFMGANIDSMAEGNAIGVAQNNTMNYAATPAGTKSLYSNIGESMSRYRLTADKTDFFSADKGGK